jgi:hypothetical protein
LIYIYFFSGGTRMRKKKTGITLFLATALLVLAGCPQEAEPLSGDATLAAIALNGTSGQVRLAYSSTEWDNPLFNLATMEYTDLFADSVAALSDATISATSNAPGASIQYSKEIAGGPGEWNKTGRFSFVSGDFVYISVRSEDGNNRNYYKAQVHDSGNIAGIVDVKINGKIATSPPEPYPNSATTLTEAITNAAWNSTLVLGTDTENVRIESTPANTYSIVQVAIAEAGSNADPLWRDLAWESTEWPQTELEEGKKVWAAESFSFIDGDYLVFKCVSPDGTTTKYFAIKASIPYVTAIALGGANGTVGIQAASASSAVATAFALATESATNATITVTAVTGASVSYAKVTDNAPAPAAFSPVTDATTANFADGDELYFKISVTGQPDRYLKYKMVVKSANATLGPNSVTVSTKAATIGLLTPGPWSITGTPGTVELTDAELAAAITVSVANPPASATLAYGEATAGWGGLALPTTWVNTGSMGVIASAEGKTIIIRVTAENGTTINYYGITLTKAGPPTMTSLMIGGYTGFGGGVDVTNIGTPAEALDNVVAGSVTLTTEQATTEAMSGTPANGPNINGVAPTGITLRYAKTTGVNPQTGDWQAPAGYTLIQFIFTNNDVLWVEATKGSSVVYYKIVVTVTG